MLFPTMTAKGRLTSMTKVDRADTLLLSNIAFHSPKFNAGCVTFINNLCAKSRLLPL